MGNKKAQGNSGTGKKKHKGKNKLLMAEKADRHILYQKSVQDTEFEYEFVYEEFKRLRGRAPRRLREDFCGTAKMACEWVGQDKRNTAVGVDLDEEVLAWGKEHNVGALKPHQRDRVTLLRDNVLSVECHDVDTIVAMNFSYQIFKDRDTMRDYFRSVREALVDDGVFFIDAFGGYDAYRELVEKTRHKGFTYVWDQSDYDPITGDMTCYIHFHFRDGSKMKKAFTYNWRLWTLPELREIMLEAGFSDVAVYWQGTDEDGEPDGNFQPAERGEADAGWICFLSGCK